MPLSYLLKQNWDRLSAFKKGSDWVINLYTKNWLDWALNIPNKKGLDWVLNLPNKKGLDWVLNLPNKKGLDWVLNLPYEKGLDWVLNLPNKKRVRLSTQSGQNWLNRVTSLLPRIDVAWLHLVVAILKLYQP